MPSNDNTLNIRSVTAYLESNLAGFHGPVEVQKFDVGQSNPTYLLDTRGKSYVLRRKPPGVLLKSAHAVDREFRVQTALAGSKVPVPEMYLLCEDDAIIGSAFYVMEYRKGRGFMDPTMKGVDNATRTGVLDEMNRVLAELHMVDVDAVGLSDYGPPGNYFERQISRWKRQYRATQTEKIKEMDLLITRLEQQLPGDDGQRTLVHGDYRIYHP